MSQLDQIPIGDGLCAWQRIGADAFVWDDDWLVFADHFGQFRRSPYHVATQFRRRPAPERYVSEAERG